MMKEEVQVSSNRLFRKKNLTRSCLWLFAFCLTQLAYSQGIGNSPYTILGVGERYTGAFSANQAMGGTGVAAANGIYINNINPALLAWNKFTVLEVGVLGQGKKITEGTKTQRDFGANLHYIAIAFPIKPRWTMSFQLMPHTYVDYEVRSTRQIPNTQNFAKYVNTGKGGLNKASISNGFIIGKTIFLGAETGLLFGGIDREYVSQTLLNDGQDYRLILLDRANHKGAVIRGGAAWRPKIKEKLFMSLGATVDFSTNLNTERLQTIEAYSGDRTVAVNAADTVQNFAAGTVTLPTNYRVGFSIEKPNKLTVTADYTIQKWSQFRNFSNRAEFSNDGFVASAGLAFTPNFLATTGYFKRTEYRFGVNYTRTPYLTPDGKNINDYHASVGFGLPMRNLSYVNLGFAVGKRDGVLKENYWRFTLGFTLSDQWFIKYKLD